MAFLYVIVEEVVVLYHLVNGILISRPAHEELELVDEGDVTWEEALLRRAGDPHVRLMAKLLGDHDCARGLDVNHVTNVEKLFH